MKNTRIIFLDTETTSDKDDRKIIQLAYRIIENWKVIVTYNNFFKTDQEISIWAKAVHNITEDVLSENWIEFSPFLCKCIEETLQDGYIIAHNCSFDKESLRNHWFDVDSYKWIDSYTIAYNLILEHLVESYSLQYLRYYFFPQDIKFFEEISAHDALWDILVLEKVFEQLKLIYEASVSDEDIYEKMVEDTKKWIVLRICQFPKHKWKTWEEIEKTDPWFIDWVWKNIKMDKKLENTILNFLHKR